MPDAFEYASLPDGQAAEIAMWRGEAIGAYTELEMSLASLFETLLESSEEVAGTIFFTLTSTAARNNLLRQLIIQKHADSYEDFFKSTFKIIQDLDSFRNKCAHYVVVSRQGDGPSRYDLRRHRFWAREDAETVSIDEIREFIRKCRFVAGSLNLFRVATGQMTGMPAEEVARLAPLYRTAIQYPPKPGHPMY
ncbi:hypothetical protein GVN24_23650 [Rhizobium sp. CRIBSB]|nr:hypothetical protein [Rhizobium sp. CRIBSB]